MRSIDRGGETQPYGRPHDWTYLMRHDESTVLARRLGMELAHFVETFGAGWTLATGPASGALSSGAEDLDDWYVAGEPAQLMLNVGDDGPRLARPRGRWHGASRLVLEPVDAQSIPGLLDTDSEALTRVIADLLRKRRASFRYCNLCFRVTPPEYHEGDACMSCQEEWRGIVH